MSTAQYAIRVRLASGEVKPEPVPPSQYVSQEHKAGVTFANTVYPLREARIAAVVELLKDGEVEWTETVTPDDKFIRITRSVPGHAHTQLWGSFSGPVTGDDIEEKVYHPQFGGRSLSIDWGGKTFYGVRHDD